MPKPNVVADDRVSTPNGVADDKLPLPLGKKTTLLIASATEHAKAMRHRAVGTEDVLWAMFHEKAQEDSQAFQLLERRGISKESVYAAYQYSDNAVRIIRLAAERAKELDHQYVGTEDVLFALFHADQDFSRSRAVEQLFLRGVTPDLVFGDAYLSENARLALMAATAEAKKRGHSRVGTEDLLYALFNNTKSDSRARYWLGKQAQTRSPDMYPDDVLAESQEESSTRMLVVGSLAGMIEAGAMQPFLYWKTMEQIAAPMIWKPSLAYRGVMINAASIAPISGVQYAANGALQKLFINMSGNERPGEWQKLAVAVGAGAVSSLFVTPAELIMISQQRLGGSIASTTKDVWGKSGVRGLMRGFAPTTWREMGWTGGLFGLQSTFKKTVQEDSKFFRRNEVASAAFASIAAGQITAVITQPFDVVKSLMQADRGITAPMRASSSLDTATLLYKEGGARAFFRGLPARATRLCGAVFILGESQFQISQLMDKYDILAHAPGGEDSL